MRPLLSVDEMREWEAALIAAGVPGIVLMENAGRGAAHILGLKERPRSDGPRAVTPTRGSCVRCADEASLSGVRYLVVCGSGNNGGDGFVVARHLHARGASVGVLCTRPVENLTGDARVAANAWIALGQSIAPASARAIEEFSGTTIVDALLGTGVRGAVSDELVPLIEAINANAAPKIALDVPSGLDADLGVVHPGPLGKVAVRAAHTVTFGHLKRGLLTTAGVEFGGRITLAHIGVPSALGSIAPSAWLLESADLAAGLVARSETHHKFTAGEVAIVGGAVGMVGAAHLAARAALRAGAGLATIHAARAVTRELDAEVLEVMTRAYDDASSGPVRFAVGRAQCIVIGPGLGRGEEADHLYRGALKAAQEAGIPVVLDADALRLSLGRLPMLRTVGDSGVPVVMTPHPGEAAHLLQITAAEVEQDRFGCATRLAERSGATVVLKGPRTIIAGPEAAPRVNAIGSAALATAGSGDVLSGIIGSLVTQARVGGDFKALNYMTLASSAVGLHGLAGELFETEHGNAGCLASDIVNLLPRARAALLSS